MADTTIEEIAIGGEEGAKWGGINTAVQDPRFLPLGVSPDENNWITGRLQDNIQLRRGQALLGQTRRNTGHASGVGVGYVGQNQVAYYSANNSLYYYNPAVLDTQEVGTNLLTGANDEDVWFAPYQNLAGFFMYLGSPHTSIFKIPLANPTSPVDQGSLTSYRFASLQIDQNRMLGVGKYDTFYPPELSGYYVSKLDSLNAGNLPNANLNQTIATGDGITKSFSGTIPVGAPNTIFYLVAGGAITAGTAISAMTEAGGQVTITSTAHGITKTGTFVMALNVTSTGSSINGNISQVVSITDANTIVVTPFGAVSSLTYGSGGTLYPLERFQDNGQGGLTSDQGGTGTINYATGAITLKFITAPANGVAIIGDNYLESSALLDFTPGITASDPPGPGYFFSQNTGGSAMASAGYQGIEYVLHNTRSWNVSLPNSVSQTEGDATNQEYWSHVGIPYSRAQYPSGDGILLLNNTNPSEPKFSILEIPPGSTNLTVVPTWVSQDLDLSTLNFSTAVVFRWGEYNILACQALVNGSPQGYNTVFFIQDIDSGVWNKLDYTVTSLADFQGSLLSGDSLSPNAFTLFSGTDDDGNIIDNYWKSSLINLGLQGQKKVRYLYIQGLIQRPQTIQVSIGLNNGSPTPAYNILGTGSYVNSSAPVGVGSNTLGSTTIGSGSITALPFEIEFPVMTDYFEYIQIQFQALGIGWAQINKLAFRDIRHKSLKSPQYSTIQP